MVLNSLSSLQELKTQFETDLSLPLAASANPVFGEGPADAKILAIGEAPGAVEDQTGRPFVGRSGQLLRRVLTEAGLNLSTDVYITNVVKHRPPENRDPTPEEIEAYRPYLDRQLELIKPQIIITLGRFSMNKFLPGAKITKIHGQTHWTTIAGRKVMLIPMFHPAAALRGTTVMNQFREDFAKLVSALEYQRTFGETPSESQDLTSSSPSSPTQTTLL